MRGGGAAAATLRGSYVIAIGPCFVVSHMRRPLRNKVTLLLPLPRAASANVAYFLVRSTRGAIMSALRKEDEGFGSRINGTNAAGQP